MDALPDDNGSKMILRRILGAEMLLIGLLGLVLSLGGAVYGYRLIDRAGNGLDSRMDLALQSLDTAEDTLLLARTGLGQLSDGLYTAQRTAVDMSRTIDESRPLLGEIGGVVSYSAPDAMEAFQAAVADISQAAAAIDDTLATLNDFSVEQSISGIPVRLDLSIGYVPEVPFEESVSGVGASLGDIPSELRALAVHVGRADSNLGVISEDMLAVSRDLDAASGSIANAMPLLDEYLRLVVEASDVVRQARPGLSGLLARARVVLTVTMLWMGLMQVAPLYLGWELVAGRRRR